MQDPNDGTMNSNATGHQASAGVPRGPGRPRDEHAEEAILTATLDLTTEVGLSQLTIAGVAERAGVGKATIYRRWPTKAELILAALARYAVRPPMPDTGSVREDLRAYQHEFVRLLAGPGGDTVPHMAAAACNDEDMREALTRWVATRRGVLREVLDRGIERGELRDDFDPDLALDLFSGPLVYRSTFAGLPIDEAVADELVDLVLLGLSVA